ncbi:hypothetical protein LR48_Vigan05g077500 [Vigna angularis]|uniref:Uncharacterized protein n=1 Tax=Phaseolus angularis TaxID=3914 RepID=A0A0L9UKF4_PHAAN|nr:hypothetical protein LR48_Vigan05g077500 [Vigna angularis]
MTWPYYRSPEYASNTSVVPLVIASDGSVLKGSDRSIKHSSAGSRTGARSLQDCSVMRSPTIARCFSVQDHSLTIRQVQVNSCTKAMSYSLTVQLGFHRPFDHTFSHHLALAFYRLFGARPFSAAFTIRYEVSQIVRYMRP